MTENPNNTPPPDTTMEAPKDISSQFPSPVFADFDPIKKPRYKLVDPIKYQQQYGDFIRQQILQNYALAQTLGLGELSTELKGLQQYAPAAAALKRGQISIDNIFNQAQRTGQLQAVMPEIYGQLTGQAERAQAYAAGRLPDSVQDRALELGVRSTSADRAAAGGFGATSSVAKKASDLMSAQQRTQLSQYGDQLLGQNIQTKAAMYLAPTEYSAAGTEIRTMPEVGAGRLTAQALAETNAQVNIPTTTAFASTIQQKQFKKNMEWQTRQFNASNEFAESQFNANAANQFSLGKFNYQAGQAISEAGAANATTAANLGVWQQQQYAQTAAQYAAQAQQAAQQQAIAGAAGSLITAAPGIINALGNLGGKDEGPAVAQEQTEMPTTTPAQVSTVPPTTTGINPPATQAPQPGYVPPPTAPAPSAPPDYNPMPAPAPESDTFENAPPEPYWPTDTTDTYLKTARLSTSGQQFRNDTQLTPTPSSQEYNESVLTMAGYKPKADQGTIPAGITRSGQMVHSNVEAASSVDGTAGQKLGVSLTTMVEPFNAYSPEEIERMKGAAAASADPNYIAALDNTAANNDPKGFVNVALASSRSPSVEQLKKTEISEPNVLATDQAYAAHSMSQVWNNASPYQKSVMVASLGLKGAVNRDGVPFDKVEIPKTTNVAGAAPVTVGKALDWFKKDINAYGVVNNYTNLSRIAKLTGGDNKPNAIATIAKEMGMLGYGTNNAAVPITEEALAKGGWSQMPRLGVGAVVSDLGAIVPNGFTIVHKGPDGQVAVPTPNADTAKGAIGKLQTLGSLQNDAVSAVVGKWQDKDQLREQIQGALDRGIGNAPGTRPATQVPTVKPAVHYTQEATAPSQEKAFVPYPDQVKANPSFGTTAKPSQQAIQNYQQAQAQAQQSTQAPGVRSAVAQAAQPQIDYTKLSLDTISAGVGTYDKQFGTSYSQYIKPGMSIYALQQAVEDGRIPAALIAGLQLGKDISAIRDSMAGAGKSPTTGALGGAVGVAGGAAGMISGYEQFQAGDRVGGATSMGVGAANSYGGASQMSSSMGGGALPGTQAAGAAAGLVGGGYGVYQGAQRWREGDRVGGGVQMGSGAAGMYGGASAASQAAGGSALPGGAAVGGAGLMVGGAYQTAQGWGKGGVEGRRNGIIGGSMMMAGAVMAFGGPVGWVVGGAMMAAAVIGNSIKTGKNEPQNNRDNIRESWQKEGFLVDKDWNVTLADGSKANIGADGKTGMHTARNPSQLTEEHRTGKGGYAQEGGLAAYDCDYTNDLDYVSNMGGNTLTRMIYGSKDTNVDQIGGQLGNAAIANIGFGQDMTEANFNKQRDNMRGFYAQAGITSKEQMYQIANEGLAQGRFDEMETIAMHQTANMLFDDGEKGGYALAQKLMQGRNKGIEMIDQEQQQPGAGAVQGVKPQQPQPKQPAPLPAGGIPSTAGGTVPVESIPGNRLPQPGASWDNIPVTGAGKPAYGSEYKPMQIQGQTPAYYKQQPMLRTKEEMQSLNAQRYSSPLAA